MSRFGSLILSHAISVPISAESVVQIYDSSHGGGPRRHRSEIYRKGKKVEIVGLNQATQAWHTTLTGQLGSAH